jgi:hypothetical protein
MQKSVQVKEKSKENLMNNNVKSKSSKGKILNMCCVIIVEEQD